MKNIKHRKLDAIVILLIIAIVVTPVDDLPFFNQILLGVSIRMAAFPLIIAIFLFWWGSLFHEREFPHHISKGLLGLFIIWSGITVLVNWQEILFNTTKGLNGLDRVISQFALLIIMFFSSFVVYYVMKYNWRENGLFIFRKYVLISFLIIGLYSSIEIFSVLGEPSARQIILEMSMVVHSGIYYLTQIRSLCAEPAWFGIYMAFAFPWLCSYLLAERHNKLFYILIFIYALILVYFTQSRTAYFIVTAEAIAFFIILITRMKRVARKGIISVCIILLLGISMVAIIYPEVLTDRGYSVFLSLLDPNQAEYLGQSRPFLLSNSTRFGSLQIALNMGLDHLIAGVGLGQYGFYLPYYITDDLSSNPEMTFAASTLPGTWWAPAHNLFARYFAETGIIGLSLLLAIWITLIRGCWRTHRMLSESSYEKLDLIGSSFIICILGTLACGLAADTFRFVGYWFVLGIGWYFIELPDIIKNSKLSA